jgi:copper resistance protein C
MTRWARRAALFLLTVSVVGTAAVAVSAAPAQAHATLRVTLPADGERLRAAPGEVRLTFSEDINPQFAQLVVTSSEGRAVETGIVIVDRTLVSRRLGTVVNGAYTVAWRVVSADGHVIQGVFRFSVDIAGGGGSGGGNGVPPTGSVAAPAAGPALNPTLVGRRWPYREIGFGAVLVGLFGMVFFLKRGRRRDLGRRL